MTEIVIDSLTRVYFAEMPRATSLNTALTAAFAREKDADHVRRTHMFDGRFENIYVSSQRLPELAPLSEFAVTAAKQILQLSPLRYGFWFNETAPGQGTKLHSHEEADELLSAVYYLAVPEDSGRLVMHDNEAVVLVEPRPGLLVLFPPELPHEVEKNTGSGTRLSIAFNFGPPNSAT